MQPIRIVGILSFVVLMFGTAHAQSPVTATCKDKTIYTGATKSGACSHHGGVASFGASSVTPSKVWVNKSTKVYHCAADPAYGKTKVGTYMTEAAAKAAGNRPDSGKACS